MKIIKYFFETIPSTNDWVKENFAQFDEEELTLVTANEQTAGRGRFKRKWVSPANLNLYATFCFFLPSNASYIANLPQVLAISVAQLLQFYGFKPILKWPNDILLSGKKIGGILCEIAAHQNKLVVINGIGLNINMPVSILEQIDQSATSLFVEKGIPFSVDKVADDLSQLYEKNLSILKEHGFAFFYPLLQTYMQSWLGQTILLTQSGKKIEGVFHSINPDGTLNFYANGQLTRIVSGELNERTGDCPTSH